MATAIVVTSGKGGTGKTSVTGGVASCLAALGEQVLCIDMDISLRNLDLTLGLADRALMDFTDVLAGRCTLARAAVTHPAIPNLALLTAPLSPLPAAPLPEAAMRELIREAKRQYSYILMDSPAGLGDGFCLARCAADRALVVSTTDVSALRDGQRTVSELSRQLHGRIHLVVNRVQPKLLRRLHTTIDDAMNTTGLPLLGVIPEDTQVMLSANAGQPLALLSQKGAATPYRNIAKRLLGQSVPLMKLH